MIQIEGGEPKWGTTETPKTAKEQQWQKSPQKMMKRQKSFKPQNLRRKHRKKRILKRRLLVLHEKHIPHPEKQRIPHTKRRHPCLRKLSIKKKEVRLIIDLITINQASKINIHRSKQGFFIIIKNHLLRNPDHQNHQIIKMAKYTRSRNLDKQRKKKDNPKNRAELHV